MRVLTLIGAACRLRRPGVVFTPAVRSLEVVLVCVLIWAATRGAVTVIGNAAQAATVAGVGVVVAGTNASALLRDLDPLRRGALRYYGFGPADFLVLYAAAAMPLTVLEAACGMLALGFPEWSDASRFGLLLAAWTAATALVTAAADRIGRADIAPGIPMEPLRIGARPRNRLASLCVVYLCSASRWPLLLAAATGLLSAYALGRFGQSAVVGVFVAGVYLAATVIGVLAEVDDTAAARYARSRYAITDAELRRAKLALVLPLLIVECLAAGAVGVAAGTRTDTVHLLACLVYLALLVVALADVATAYTRRHRMLPAAELGGLLITSVPVLPLVVFPAAAYLLRGSEHA
ncbi:hypothetical protein [Actinomyces ruminis]|uniref:ABC-2 type transport system permease protein n=1 Tax=Actinomyces ruminis TaxID=1937003 RepID=A0ABX4M8U4_9ACTO|nr:hypothetical protein [Actinomyces ruminis]PHP51860.1 hypothetical protein BW737_013645 [Actinomyces ruminis]